MSDPVPRPGTPGPGSGTILPPPAPAGPRPALPQRVTRTPATVRLGTVPPAAPEAARTPWWKYERSNRVKPEEIMNFSRQAASFIKAGIPLLDALGVIAEDDRGSKLAPVLLQVADDLRAGLSFAASVGRHTKVFPPYYVSMLRSAELTGRLDTTFEQLALYLERDIENRRRVKSALTYPAVIAVMGVVTVAVLALYVLPKFEGFFDELGADLPLPTRILLAITGFVGSFGLYVALGLAVLALVAVLWMRQERGKEFRDRLLLRLPAVGIITKYVVIERFCRSLAAMVLAGVPLPDALAVAGQTANNRVYRDAIAQARDEMLKGAGLARPLAASGLFPAAANQMIRVGEATGTLDQQLVSAAEFYEREMTYRLKRFTDLFEPAVIVVMGLVVGFVAVALISAMYGVFNQVNL